MVKFVPHKLVVFIPPDCLATCLALVSYLMSHVHLHLVLTYYSPLLSILYVSLIPFFLSLYFNIPLVASATVYRVLQKGWTGYTFSYFVHSFEQKNLE